MNEELEVEVDTNFDDKTKYRLSQHQTPVGDRILVKPDVPEEKSSGGIIYTEEHKPKSLVGIVIAIGDETKHEFQVRPGQRVRFGVYSGTYIQEQDEDELLIMRQEDIYTIIT